MKACGGALEHLCLVNSITQWLVRLVPIYSIKVTHHYCRFLL